MAGGCERVGRFHFFVYLKLCGEHCVKLGLGHAEKLSWSIGHCLRARLGRRPQVPLAPPGLSSYEPAISL